MEGCKWRNCWLKLIILPRGAMLWRHIAGKNAFFLNTPMRGSMIEHVVRITLVWIRCNKSDEVVEITRRFMLIRSRDGQHDVGSEWRETAHRLCWRCTRHVRRYDDQRRRRLARGCDMSTWVVVQPAPGREETWPQPAAVTERRTTVAGLELRKRRLQVQERDSAEIQRRSRPADVTVFLWWRQKERRPDMWWRQKDRWPTGGARDMRWRQKERRPVSRAKNTWWRQEERLRAHGTRERSARAARLVLYQNGLADDSEHWASMQAVRHRTVCAWCLWPSQTSLRRAWRWWSGAEGTELGE